jgi:hypothetical protein
MMRAMKNSRPHFLSRSLLPLGLLLCGALVTLFANTTAAEPTQSPAEGLGLEGHFVYAKTLDHGRAIVRAAMEKMIEELNPIYRSLARRKLNQADPLIHSITIARPNDKISVRFVGEKTSIFVTAPGVREKVRLPNGNEVDLTQRVKGDVLTQVFLGPKARTTNKLSLVAGGQGLQLHSRIKGNDADGTVQYRLSYKRRQ